MKLIAGVTIQRFRSIAEDTLADLGDFSSLAGPNNSGKSNVLRALNAFFNEETDVGAPVSIDNDHYRFAPKKKQAKRIRITVSFALPPQFRFRAKMEGVKSFLNGRSFAITKEWSRGTASPTYYLNDKELRAPDDRAKIDQFLALISFRYIPNRVLPLDIIRNEHQALRDVLVRRLAKRGAKGAEFDALRKTSTALIANLTKHIKGASPDVGTLQLATPDSWKEMVFSFGYKVVTGDVVIDDSALGSGIQSLLMLETLALIDRDYFQQFGWRQAAIWALEEPESSLHSSLEAKVAEYLADIAQDRKGRLQIIATTHSDLVLQFSDRVVFVERVDYMTRFKKIDSKKGALEEAAKIGISRWVHPILAEPLRPIMLVEGVSDKAFFSEVVRLLDPGSNIAVRCLADWEDGESGGVDRIKGYLKASRAALKTRSTAAPVAVVLDWDSAKKVSEFEKLISPEMPCAVFAIPEDATNPSLTKSFHGIERSMPDRVITEADKASGVVATTPRGKQTVQKDDLPGLKSRILEVVERGLLLDDLRHIQAFAQGKVIKFLRGPKRPVGR